jgi:putative phage-type endonuclease
MQSFNIHPQVQFLNNLPQVAQRSAEWFNSRKMRITASEIGCVLGVNPYKSRNVFWKEKLSVLKNEPEKERESSWISEWGVRYEPIVQNIIRQRFQKSNYNLQETLFEYGMICHPTIPFLGASPDGILFDGTMIEIKCPPTRQIEENEVVPYYYSQMQLQMECCQLDKVEFIECKIFEYRTFELFLLDSIDQQDIFTSINQELKGVVAYNSNENKYYYFNDSETINISCWSPEKKIRISKIEMLNQWMHQYQTNLSCKLFYWKLELFSSKMIYRNTEYINNMIQETSKFWDSLLEAKEKNILECPLPKPKSFLFENFIYKDIFVTYKKKVSPINFALPTSTGTKKFGFKMN